VLTFEETLAHFGIKGMQWGVRKKRPLTTAQADHKWGKQASTFKIRRQVYNSSFKRVNEVELPNLNNKPAYKNADFRKDSPLRRAYLDDAVKMFNKVLNEESDRILGPSPSGHYRLNFTQGLDNRYPSAEIIQVVRHADDSLKLNITWGPMGHIISCKIDEPLIQFDSFEDFLSHFGIKGMRWGVRRSSSQLHAPSDDHASAQEAKTKAKKSGTKSLSNQELQSLINRMNLEQQYNRIVPPSVGKKVASAGAKFAGDILLSVGRETASKLARDQATKVIASLLKK